MFLTFLLILTSILDQVLILQSMLSSYIVAILLVLLGCVKGAPLSTTNDDDLRMDAWLHDQQQLHLQLMHQQILREQYREYILTGHGRQPPRPTEARQIIQDLLSILPPSTDISAPQFARIYDLLATATFRVPHQNVIQENTRLLLKAADRVREPTLGTSSFLQTWLSRLEGTTGRRTVLLQQGIQRLRMIYARLFLLEGESTTATRWVESLTPTDLLPVLSSEIPSLQLIQAIHIFSAFYNPSQNGPERDTLALLSLTLTRLGSPVVSEAGVSLVHVSTTDWTRIESLMDAKKHTLNLDGLSISEEWDEVDARLLDLVGRARPVAHGSVEENLSGRGRRSGHSSSGSLARGGFADTSRQTTEAHRAVEALEILVGHHPFFT
jgi:hypothetical protein